MEKIYVKPAIRWQDIETEDMLAESLTIDPDTPVSGDDGLSRSDRRRASVWDDDDLDD